ncbi:MFS general substrate transporter [Cryphonectria parasitica EP155]|uniref:MFS general substrate transporter n=1 Tax=Cryphonectria parasitica (strain ATCC 38755 / EP155) TaxID=660469 RepID=A0A9P4YA81_CRYP1|nr:MFS general substrate transporter [Cryphonectria parasitica EP155]KAF3769315.1 MFS general substrate transporter [Cryphonectria parasitica EP155]
MSPAKDPLPSGGGTTPPSESDHAVHDDKNGSPGGKRELTLEMAEDDLPFAWPSWKKWWVLTVIFLVQTSMNFNTSLYSNGLDGIEAEFGVSAQVARLGATLFLILYAFGCELWAPWSEEFGRKPIMQASLFLVNVWCVLVALSPNFGSLLVGRCLGGLSSAGGSVTLGMIADMFDADHQQYAVAYIVLSSVGGSILGPIVGGFVQYFLTWRWCIWIQLIFGGFVQLLHLLTVPETRTTVCLDKIAKKRRKAGEEGIYGPNEINPVLKRMDFKEICQTWYRPFKMFVTEPIVLTLSLLSGFSDALIFMQIQSFSLVYTQWNFNAWQLGLAFIPIGIGYLVAHASFIPAIRRNIRQRESKPGDEHAQYESRLWWLLFTAPCLPIGLLIFALTCNGPPIHWIGSMFASGIIGIANYAIYMATIDYMVCAYGPFSASATGGNGFSRDFLAGVLTNAATPFYTNIPGPQNKPLQNASFILFAISFCLVGAVYVIYWFGPTLRKNSAFAQTLAKEAAEHHRRPSAAATGGAAGPTEKEKEEITETAPVYASRPRLGPGSRTSSYQISKDIASRNASRNASRAHSRAHSFEESRGHGSEPHTPGAHGHQHVHHRDLEQRLHGLGRIDSEVQ